MTVLGGIAASYTSDAMQSAEMTVEVESVCDFLRLCVLDVLGISGEITVLYPAYVSSRRCSPNTSPTGE